MTFVVQGMYRDGRIDLLEKPARLAEGIVRVEIIQEPIVEAKPQPRYLQFGKYKGERMSTPEDFQEAEWHGEEEFDDLYGN